MSEIFFFFCGGGGLFLVEGRVLSDFYGISIAEFQYYYGTLTIPNVNKLQNSASRYNCNFNFAEDLN